MAITSQMKGRLWLTSLEGTGKLKSWVHPHIMDIHDQLVGRGAAMRDIAADIAGAARTGARVLITGERGVGKDLVARLVHRQTRQAGAFVAVRCLSGMDSLLEMSLFGIGGADRTAHGALAGARGGTLFLDEVGCLSAPVQERLSSCLAAANRQHVVAASTTPLFEQVEAGAFRDDLYYRLNTVLIEVPPLRARREDVPPLVHHYLRFFAERYGVPAPQLSYQTEQALVAYDWPGNVRELRSAAEQLVITREVGAPAWLTGAAQREDDSRLARF